MGSKFDILTEILPCLLVCFIEEDTDFCVYLPDLAEVSETEKRLSHQDKGAFNAIERDFANTALYPLNLQCASLGSSLVLIAALFHWLST